MIIEPGWAQPKVEKLICLPVGSPPTHRRNHRGLVHFGLGSILRQATLRPDPWLWELAFGTWNVSSLAGKEMQLEERVNQHHLGTVKSTLVPKRFTGFRVFTLLELFME